MRKKRQLRISGHFKDVSELVNILTPECTYFAGMKPQKPNIGNCVHEKKRRNAKVGLLNCIIISSFIGLFLSTLLF